MDLNSENRTRTKGTPFRSYAVHAFLLMSLWLVLSGQFDAFHILAGVVSVIGVLWFNQKLQRIKLSADDHAEAYRIRPLAFLSYCGWLFWEIIVSSIQVAVILLRPTLRIDPHFIKAEIKLPNLAAKVMLGNSITLTPGTVTIQIKGNQFYIHTLTEQASATLVNGIMPAKVARVFGAEADSLPTDIQTIKSESDLL